MLDTILAELYEVPVKVLNQAVKRNRDRFPEDFMFQLTAAESQSLRSQFVTLKLGRGRHRKYCPLHEHAPRPRLLRSRSHEHGFSAFILDDSALPIVGVGTKSVRKPAARLDADCQE